MLPAPNRLKNDVDFKKVARFGRWSRTKVLTLKYAPNRLPVARFGIVVSTKVDKRATVRNRLQRRLREILRLKLSAIKPGYDLMLICRPEAKNLSYQALEQEVLEALTLARLYQTEV